ncbi:interleukin-5 receptor subunit alpha isoform X1 [Esox lucius]|uniref:Fibronectin type-III domain-containing protein n=2 Tax=Esox lucius TaxID=8010 RepID=A0A3P9AGQ9_ESOLU|nr:interleukin-5 receptor subunit alpha isoform X1 [Esox lucius]
MMWKHLECLLALQCFICLVRPAFVDEKALPEPCDLSLTWINEFQIKLSWNLSKDLDPSCRVSYEIKKPETMVTHKSFVELYVFLVDAVTYTVQTKPEECSDRTISKPVNITVTKPTELVKNFNCSLYTSTAMNCSWLIASQAPEDLLLYYKYAGENDIEQCSDYLYTAGQRTGCHLRGNISEQKMYFQVNGTVNGLSVRNTFLVEPLKNIKPQAPKVKITKESRSLSLSWAPPDFKDRFNCWNYTLRYSKCQETQCKNISKKTNENIPYDPRCQYRFQVKAVYSDKCGTGQSDWSEEEIYGAEDSLIIVIAIIVPASLFLFVILFLCCLMKYRETIFPKIPQPSVILKGMLNNSKEQTAFKRNLYIPVEENVEHKISLEIVPPLPIMQPDS